MVRLGAFERGTPSEGQGPIEEPSTDDICDFLASSERCKMALSVI